jgi:S1-C subfamily serine protease
MNATLSSLTALSTDLARAVADAGPSIVYVDAHPRRDASGIAWDEHHLVTVDHAIEREDDIDILLANGAKATARLVGRDPSTDVAVLHTDATLTPLARADLSELAVGHIVLALARDEDGAPGASFGIVSSLDGPWRTWRGGDVDRFIRPDLNVYPSFSGGALVNAEGKVVGMNTWGLSRRSALTLPVTTLERVVAALSSGRRISRGYLGVATQGVRLPETLRAKLGRDQASATIVVDVAADGPAERGGIFIGDVIVAIGFEPIEDSDDLQRALGSDTVGQPRPVHVLRAGELHELTITIGERPHDDD